MKKLCLLLTLLTSPALAYDATYNFDDFLTEPQHQLLRDVEAKMHRTYGDGKIPPIALQRAGRIMLENMNVFQKIQAVKVAASCNSDLLNYCRSVPQTSVAMKQCIERKKRVLSPSCDTALKTTLGETLQKNAIIQRVNLPRDTKLNHQLSGNGKTAIASVITSQTISDHGATFAPGLVELGKLGVVSGVLARDAIIQGIPFQATEKPINFHENGAVESGTLSRDATYQGMTFKGGSTMILYDNRSVHSGMLAREKTIDGLKFAAGKMVYFTEDGLLSAR